MPNMTSWERVHTAFRHAEPDRVPTAIGGGPYGIVDPVYFELLKLSKLGEPVPPFRTGHNISYQDDRLLEWLGSDFRYVYPGASPSSPSQETETPGTFLDGFGQIWKRAVPYFYPDRGILSGAQKIDQIDETVHWPDPNNPIWTAGVAKRARLLRQETACWITARMVTSHGPFQTACDLRGTENLLIDLVDNEAFALHLIERVTDTLNGLLEKYLEACGQQIDMIELPGDDYAGNTSLLISPAMFRKYIRPSLKRLVDTVRSFRSDLKIMLHSDGMIYKLLPEFIELGIDAVHPLEPLPGMDLPKIKAEFGHKLTFIGGIDITRALPGTRADVITEVKQRIRQLGAGGGYVLAPSNHVQADVPAENIVTLFQAAHEVGRYPLSGLLAS